MRSISLESPLLLACSFVAAVAIVWWVRTSPNRSKEYPDRIRMPKVVPFFCWFGIIFGLILGLIGWSPSDGALPARIASVAMVLAGLAVLGMYRNFYVAPRQDEISFRTHLGKEHVLPYSDIADYRMFTAERHEYVTVKSIHGAKLTLNTSIYGRGLGPLLRAIDYHQANGRWPVRGELPLQKQPGR